MKNRRSLMISTMLMSAMGVGVGGIGNVWAADVQCLKTPSCEELGYTEISCFQNNGVKCPYGDKYFCVCPMNYKFTCTGENQTGGVGENCNGKYTACNCSGGLMWGDGACVENCPLGSILFDDFTCSDDVVSGKTPIGVVVYKDGKGAGQALALESIGSYTWGGYGTDISNLPNYTSAEAASKDYASCQNSILIKSQGSSSSYPAVWAAHNYTTAGTKAGDWCLPAAGIFTSYYNNQEAINTGFSRANGTQFTTTTNAWSSSEYTSGNAWYSYFYFEYGLGTTTENGSYEVRPVVGFCDDAENYVYDQATDSCVKDDICRLGSIFYSDMTCSMRLKDGKTPIGVVVYVDGTGGGQAMALKSLGGYKWSTEYVDISGLTNYTSQSAASQDFASCENSAKIRAQGDSSTYPAVWRAYNYTTTGTKVGDWCLPAAGIFTSYYNNQSTINTGFSRANGTQFTNSTYAWSSSEGNSYGAWDSDFSLEYGLSTNYKDDHGEVRPVLEFSQGGISCDSSYQYTCTGEGEIGLGDSCNGKYKSCTCDSSYKYTCTGEGEIGSDGSCNGKYKSCTCDYGYYWSDSSCKKNSCRGYSSPFYCLDNAIDYSDSCQSGSETLYKCSACNEGSEYGFAEAQMCSNGSCISIGNMCVDWN